MKQKFSNSQRNLQIDRVTQHLDSSLNRLFNKFNEESIKHKIKLIANQQQSHTINKLAVDGDFGGNIVSFDSINTLTDDDTVGNLTGVKGQQGVSFQLSDFSGAGALSAATGIKINSGTAIDPSVIGLAAIPESNTYALLAGLTALATIATRRRRA